MPAVYYLGEKKSEPVNPVGKLIIEYAREGHCPLGVDEIKQMLPQVPNPEEALESLARAGFLSKENEDGSSSGHIKMRSPL